MEFRPEHIIIDVSGKYPRLWALKGAGPNDVRRWYNFGALTLIHTVAPAFWEISELPDWRCGKIEDGSPSTKKEKATYRTHPKSRSHEEKEATYRTHRKSQENKDAMSSALTIKGELDVHKPEKYLRLKVEYELRLWWVLLKESTTMVSQDCGLVIEERI
ncbi:hypothetical protein ACS0TY_010179 [Phlomoides rotata]